MTRRVGAPRWSVLRRADRVDDLVAEVRVDVGPSVPGWAFEVALVGGGLAAFLVAGVGTRIEQTFVGVGCVVLLWLAVRALMSHSHAFAITAVAMSACFYVFVPTGGVSWRAPLLVLLAHLCVRASWFAGSVGRTGRVEVAVLRTEGLRFAVFNLAGQGALLVIAVATLTRDGGTAGSNPAMAVAGGVLLLLVALVVLVTRRPPRSGSPGA